MHAQLSLYEEVHKCDLKFYIAHENVLCVLVKIIIFQYDLCIYLQHTHKYIYIYIYIKRKFTEGAELF